MSAAAYISDHSQYHDLVFIWGFEPVVYFLSERDFATRYLFNYPLYGIHASTKVRSQFLLNFEKDAPLYFIVLKNDAIPHVTGVTDDSLHAFLDYAELNDYIESHYRLEKTIEDFQIYRRIE